MSAAFIGLDLAKSMFQVHGVDVESTRNRGSAPGDWQGVGGESPLR
jgi:hypothetical protein